ncbi:MAG: putative glycoside hydrolase [Bacillota bacterium]|nr:putative glycoside hydrolase [Bacillota bacterium]
MKVRGTPRLAGVTAALVCGAILGIWRMAWVAGPPAPASPEVAAVPARGRARTAGPLLTPVGPLLDPSRPERAGRVSPPEPAPLFGPYRPGLVPPPYTGPNPPRPDRVRGIYVTGWTAGLPQRFASLVRLVDETALNTMVIDVKDDTGTLTYRVPLPPGMGPGDQTVKVADIDRLLATLREHGIYPIARLVVFKDQVLPKVRPELAVLRPDGSLFRDRAGFLWANPYDRQVWEYNLAVAKDAASRGFAEIQFDYVRFPDLPKSVPLVFPGQDDRTKAEVIRDFLAYARRELFPYDVRVSADIFGLVSTVKDDLGIGQHLEAVASVVDWISPMAYPSHYARGEFGLRDPDADPYTTVYLSLRDAVRRLKAAQLATQVVPWLQDFSLRHIYGEEEVLAQVKAAADLGIHDWYLWNPTNRYTEGALRRLGLDSSRWLSDPPASASVKPSTVAPASTGSLPPNEAGQVMILMYHRFSPRAAEWNRTPDEFRQDLETLYRQGYRLLSLRALLDGRITTPRGYTPVVLTFDDGWQSQFNYRTEGGRAVLDPDCAVGILEEFVRRHPDMGRAGTFYLNANPFGQPALAKQKLAYLAAHGYELGNHTLNHLNLRRAAPEAGTRELAQLALLVSSLLPGYEMDTMALPFGALPHDPRVARQGWDGRASYRHRAVLLVGANPAPSPYSSDFDPFNLPRVQASNRELGRWLAYFAAHPEQRFVSDGDPATVTVPAARAGEVDGARLKAQGRRLAVEGATPAKRQQQVDKHGV